jgi:hypothetical protein
MNKPMNSLGHVFFSLINEKSGAQHGGFGLSPVQFGHRMSEFMYPNSSVRNKDRMEGVLTEWARLNEHVKPEQLLTAFRQRFIRTSEPML